MVEQSVLYYIETEALSVPIEVKAILVFFYVPFCISTAEFVGRFEKH